MHLTKIEVHDWCVLGWLFVEERVLLKLGFADQSRFLAFEGVSRLWLDELMAQNIMYDLVQVFPSDPQFDAFVRRLDQSLAARHAVPIEDVNVYALRASVGLDGVVACKNVREASFEEWIGAASATG